MREIKFRGLSSGTRKWIYGWYLGNRSADYSHIISWDGLQFTGEETRTEVETETVGQFTGLKDKNGKEIFEGDILKWNDKLWPVFWSEKLTKYVMGTTKGCEIIGCGRSTFCEVIGNIYENPELIRGA